MFISYMFYFVKNYAIVTEIIMIFTMSIWFKNQKLATVLAAFIYTESIYNIKFILPYPQIKL